MSSPIPVDRGQLRPVPLAAPAEPHAGAARLPAPRTSLIGREREIAAAGALLLDEAVTLLTLTGPGGVGKTRLALRLACGVAPAFADGVVFVPLASVGHPDLVLDALAQALNLPEVPDRPLAERLRHFLGARRTLVVLDNFEHLLAAAPVVADLLAASAGLRVLVTSRARLRVSGEQEFPVPPLELPDQGAEGGRSVPEVADMGRVEAVRLFVERARATKPDFALTDVNAAAVAAICRRLDGLPLAIELAAARVGHLPPTVMLDRLRHRLSLLSGGPRDQPARHQTMRAAVAWSHDLLDSEEQALFRRLAVFSGGFTLDAAESVASRAVEQSSSRGEDSSFFSTARLPLDSSTFLDLVSSLVDKSLLRMQERSAEEERFVMLETVRDDAAERLVASGEAVLTRDAHAAWCLALAEAAEPLLLGRDRLVWLDRLEADYDNLRTALGWLIERRVADGALRLGAALSLFWIMRGSFAEGAGWLRRALALDDGSSSRPRARALFGVAALVGNAGDHEQAAALGVRALAQARAVGDPQVEGNVLHLLGTASLFSGKPAAAVPWLEQALARYATGADPGQRTWRNVATIHHGMALAALGDLERATMLLEAARAAFGAESDGWGADLVRMVLGDLARAQGAVDLAATEYAGALTLAVAQRGRWMVAEGLVTLAGIAVDRGDPLAAARLIGAAAALQGLVGADAPVLNRPRAATDVAAARAALGEEAYVAAWSAGQRLPLEAAVAEALAVSIPTSAAGEGAGGRTGGGRAPLTRREREILRLLVEGCPDREIAERLAISPRTASKHVAAILAKLDVETRTAAATYAVRQGLV